MSERLSQISTQKNRVTMWRLRQVMNEYHLSQAHTATLLEVSRSLVTRWFLNHKQCPDAYPEHLRAMLEIQSPESIDYQLNMKRHYSRK